MLLWVIHRTHKDAGFACQLVGTSAANDAPPPGPLYVLLRGSRSGPGLCPIRGLLGRLGGFYGRDALGKLSDDHVAAADFLVSSGDHLPQVLEHPGARPTRRHLMDEHTISPAGDPFHAAPDDQDHPHACLNGYVYLGYTAVDEQTGEEVERIEALPCRRCASEVAGR